MEKQTGQGWYGLAEGVEKGLYTANVVWPEVLRDLDDPTAYINLESLLGQTP